MNKRLAIFLLASALALAAYGCSAGPHKITEGEACSECHTDEHPEHDPIPLADAVTTDSPFEVSTSEDKVYLCSIRYGGDDGTKLVPTLVRSIPPDERAAISAEPGTYLICAGSWDNPKSISVIVTEGNAASETVCL